MKDSAVINNRIEWIDSIKPLLILLVIYVHSMSVQYNYIYSLQSTGLLKYHIVSFIPHVLGNLAVPVFFFISGYLFFLNKDKYDIKDYVRKMKRMFFSIFVPYILWILLYNLYNHYTAFDILNPLTYCFSREWGDNHNLWGTIIKTTSPSLYPFWYIKDLMIMEVLTPIIWLLLRKYKWCTIGILGILYFLQVPLFGKYISLTAIFVFTLGAFFSIQSINPCSFSKKFWIIFASMSILLLIPSIKYDGFYCQRGYYPYVCLRIVTIPLFILFGSLIKSCWQCVGGARFSDATFFVYAAHAFILPTLMSLDYKFSFIVTPIICYMILVILYNVLFKYIPFLGTR